MDGKLVECEACGHRIVSGTRSCPHCSCEMPLGWRGLSGMFRTRHPALHVVTVGVVWTWFIGVAMVAAAFVGLFVYRLG